MTKYYIMMIFATALLAVEFSIQKFSSNIIDKLLNICERDKLLEQLNQIRTSLFNLNHIKGVYNNKYGKFILIKVANFMSEAERGLGGISGERRPC